MLKKIISVLLISALILSSLCFGVNAVNEEVSDGDIIEIPQIEEPIVGKELTDDQVQLRVNHNYVYVGTAKYWGAVRYYYYDCYKDTINWYVMTGLNLTMAISHTKNSGPKELGFTISQTYSSQTANEFSVSLGAEAGVADMVKASAGLGYGVTNTVGRSYQASSTVKAIILASADTGYYKMHVCYNYYAMKIIQKKTDNTFVASKEIAMPFGESYSAVLYSPTAANGSWRKW